MGLSKFADCDTLVIGDLGNDIGDKSRITDSPFAFEEPLVGCWFPLLNFSNNLVQLCFLQGLVTVDRFYCFFDFFELFPSDSESANEIANRQGGEEKGVTGGPADP
jgi:hypothetical protein